MKKFKKRSKRGQRNLLLCAGIVLSLFFIISACIFDKIFFLRNNPEENPDENSDVVEIIPADETIAPSITPSDKENTRLEWLNEIVLNPAYAYGSDYYGVSLTESVLDNIMGVDLAIYDSVSIDDVGLGDIAVCGSYIGICVGQYNDALLFAYVSSVPSTVLPAGGVYLGYSMEQRDKALCGMLPVPFESYYDTGVGNATFLDSVLHEKISSAKDEMLWYENGVYYYGRMMSGCYIEELVDSLPMELLSSTHLMVDEIKFLAFLEKFPTYAKSDFVNYSFKVTKETGFDNYSIFTVSCISMDAETLFTTSGEWRVSIYRNGSFLPCVAPQINKYALTCGFVPEKETSSSVERTEDELVKDSQMLEAGFQLQDDGTYIYHGHGYSIVVNLDSISSSTNEASITSKELSSSETLVFRGDYTDEEISRIIKELNINLPYVIERSGAE